MLKQAEKLSNFLMALAQSFDTLLFHCDYSNWVCDINPIMENFPGDATQNGLHAFQLIHIRYSWVPNKHTWLYKINVSDMFINYSNWVCDIN